VKEIRTAERNGRRKTAAAGRARWWRGAPGPLAARGRLPCDNGPWKGHPREESGMDRPDPVTSESDDVPAGGLYEAALPPGGAKPRGPARGHGLAVGSLGSVLRRGRSG